MLNEETHIAAELVDGELLVRIHFHNTTESYTVGGVKLNDGRNHLIQVGPYFSWNEWLMIIIARVLV